jgi:hypothetical protein
MEGGIEETGRRGRRRKQLLGYLTETWEYWTLKEKALDRKNSLWNRLWICRKTDYGMNEWINVQGIIQESVGSLPYALRWKSCEELGTVTDKISGPVLLRLLQVENAKLWPNMDHKITSHTLATNIEVETAVIPETERQPAAVQRSGRAQEISGYVTRATPELPVG